MNEKIITCEEALRLLAAHLDGELEGAPRHDVERHLDVCRSCFSRAEFERRLKSQLAALREQPVQSKFAARIRVLISRFAVAPDVPRTGEQNE
jgi:predicted anti-sigma-YlaC factor YlaD